MSVNCWQFVARLARYLLKYSFQNKLCGSALQYMVAPLFPKAERSATTPLELTFQAAGLVHTET
jgi:hypothetical protein